MVSSASAIAVETASAEDINRQAARNIFPVFMIFSISVIGQYNGGQAWFAVRAH
jgi:hypothetical protein